LGDARARTLPTNADAARHTAKLWAIELSGKNPAPLLPARFATFSVDGINTIVTVRGGWTAKRHSRLVALAKSTGIRIVDTRAIPTKLTGRAALRNACRTKTAGADTCAVSARNATQARNWVRKGTVRYVVLHVASANAFMHLTVKGTKKTRLI